DRETKSSPRWTPREVYRKAIDQLVPMDSTNISGGLELGAAELRKATRAGASRRLLLLTDGIANCGVATPDGLASLVKKLAAEGFSVTTIGPGLDYQAQLLSTLAEVGGGNYHYVENAERLAGIFDAEFRGLRTLVAKGVRVTLSPRDGAELLQVVEWTNERT